jgi:hypothetical protein
MTLAPAVCLVVALGSAPLALGDAKKIVENTAAAERS